MFQIERRERGDGHEARAGRIVAPADASFPRDAIDLLVEEPVHRNTEQQLESTERVSFGKELFIELQYVVNILVKRFMGYLYAVDFKSFGDVHQMRRSETTNFAELRLQQGINEPCRTTFSIAARDHNRTLRKEIARDI